MEEALAGAEPIYRSGPSVHLAADIQEAVDPAKLQATGSLKQG
jgi:hypothetical protein